MKETSVYKFNELKGCCLASKQCFMCEKYSDSSMGHELFIRYLKFWYVIDIHFQAQVRMSVAFSRTLNLTVEWETLWFHIQEAPSSNLSPETSQMLG
jgi:hypothetical protein